MKNIVPAYLSILLLFLPILVVAQGFTKVYNINGSSAPISFRNIAGATDGGWYAVGESSNRISVARFDENGEVRWIKAINGSRSSRGILETADASGILLFNRSNTTAANGGGASVIHISSAGEFISEQSLSHSTGAGDWAAVERIESGEFIAIGSIFSNVFFQNQLILAKFSATGNLIWSKLIDHSGLGRFSHVMVRPSGGFYLVGTNFIDYSALAEFDDDGNPIWGLAYEFATGASVFVGYHCAGDSLLLVGRSAGPDVVGNPILLLKVDAIGTPNWGKNISAPTNMNPLGIYNEGDGRLVIAALSDNRFSPIQDNDNTIIRISEEGELLSSLTFGSDIRDFAIASARIGNRIVFGGSTTLPDTTLPDNPNVSRPYISVSYSSDSGCEKEFPVTISEEGAEIPRIEELPIEEVDTMTVTSVATVVLTDLTFTVETSCESLPSAVAYIQSCDTPKGLSFQEALSYLEEKTADVELLLYDLAGRLVVRQRNPNRGQNFSNRQQLPSGMYFYSLSFEDCSRQQRLTGKLLVTKLP